MVDRPTEGPVRGGDGHALDGLTVVLPSRREGGLLSAASGAPRWGSRWGAPVGGGAYHPGHGHDPLSACSFPLRANPLEYTLDVIAGAGFGKVDLLGWTATSA